ncbi:TetR/AcrR family transcriptional regulator [Streptomyces albofaciens JCM 4342]|uniref:TetR/AcrR family transcriptional regulator n=1 Tax=Streptomyces albofaciens TaxID=66866 RepID=UPI00123A8BA6|nr:TetR/AcrR family transcriptional regulator [Streptomyces albofaciens]KAA6212014.1 TetR/AcrR family transcriptional regulator [Streptomyces albofaciens JCM 4342]
MAKPTGTKPMRSDAVRSRRQLMQAATEAFAEQGVEASVSDIAERAGIGKGTVFRHFATKDDLLAAIVSENQFSLAATGERLAETEEPADALMQFMTAAIELQISNRAFCQVAHGEAHDHPDVRNGLAALERITAELTDRARRHGAIRRDITGQDVMLLMSGVYQTASPLLASQPHLWRRYLRLVFDGMRADTPPLPGPAPQTETTPSSR